MRIQSLLMQRAGGFLLANVLHRWMSTLDTMVGYYDPLYDPAHPRFPGPAIFLQWHEYIPALLHLRGNCGLTVFVSKHRDAEWLVQTTNLMGYQAVRGSTGRGGSTAIRQLMQKGQARVVITPDGPLGPRRNMAPGPIYLASKMQVPLIPVGIGYDRPWRLNSWDRFAVPRPASRLRIIIGPAFELPPRLRRPQIEECRSRVECLLNDLTLQAENWAASGRELVDQRPFPPGHMALRSLQTPVIQADTAAVQHCEPAARLLRQSA